MPENKHCTAEKWLLIFVIFLLTIVIILFVTVLLRHETVCTKPECIEAAHHLLDFIDPSVDPCEDFYQFACGNFLKKSFELNENTAVGKMKQITKNRLNALITEPIKGSIPKSLKLQRDFYQVCLNTSALEEDNNNSFLDLVHKIGNWPIFERRFWNEKLFNWVKIQENARNLGLNYGFFLTFTFSRKHDMNDTKLLTLLITSPVKFDIKMDLEDLYVDLMVFTLGTLGANEDEVKIEFRKVLEFHGKLMGLIEEDSEGENESKVQIEEIGRKSNFSNLNWTEIVRNITRNDFSGNDLVYVDLKYLEKLQNLLETTPKKIQANFILWKLIWSNYEFLTKEIRDKFEMLQKLDEDNNISKSRKKLCFEKALHLFPKVAEAVYIRKYLDLETRKTIGEILENIRGELLRIVPEIEWMDEESRRKTEKKLSEMLAQIGGKEVMYNEEEFEKYLKFDQMNFTSNYVEIHRLLYLKLIDDSYNKINLNYTDYVREMIDATVLLDINAFYSPFEEKMILPAPLMQDFIYNKNRPYYMNYGALGSIIGHEFTHGLLSGANLVQISQIEAWWSNSTKENFKQKTKCLIQDYENYVTNHSIYTRNGTIALEEILADTVGPNLAYLAYLNWLERKGSPEDQLPGMAFNPRHIFWIMTATFRCYQPKSGEETKKDDNHAAPSYSVVGSLRNSPYFSRDFGCKTGTFMNPKDKCKIV